MRLKNPQDLGPISVHNGNDNHLLYSNRNPLHTVNNTTGDTQTGYNATVGATNQDDTLQWCNTINTIQHHQNENRSNYNQHHLQQQQQNNKQRPLLYNINNNLATRQLTVPPRTTTRGTTSSLCSESSPDDSLLDYEDAHQSCSSVESTPQDEDRGFDLSDSESLSDDGNLSGGDNNTRTRGIVNPNYPGFQHLAHTLDYSIKVLSDTDFTDDDLDIDPITTKDANNINNNNNNNEDDLEYKIDSVNRLDSVENIQKVFYDKPKLNIPLEPIERDPEKRSNLDEGGSSSYTGSDEDLEGNLLQDVSDPESSNHDEICGVKINQANIDIIGDFGKEIEQELGRLVERGVERDLEEAVEKLTVASDLSPSALKYNIEPNTEQPFEKSCSVKIHSVELLEPVTVQQKVEVFLESSTNEIYEPINIKEDVKDVKNTVTYFKEVDEDVIKQLNYVDVKLDNQEVIIESSKQVQPENILFEVPQFPETVNLKSDSEENDEGLIQTKEQTKMKPLEQEILESSTATENPNDISMKTPMLSYNDNLKLKTTDALLSNAQDVIKNLEKDFLQHKMDCDDIIYNGNIDTNRKTEDDIRFNSKEEKNRNDNEKDEDSMVPRKKEKMEINYVKKRKNPNQMIGSLVTIPRRELSGKNREIIAANRRSLPPAREKKRPSPELLGGFDVYNIETAMPKIDLDAIESHLKAAREEERRRRTDREEIRRRLAMGSEDDYYSGNDRPGRKPSLQSRLQSGMNLQICFMNETASDTDSPNSDNEYPVTNTRAVSPPMKRHGKQQLKNLQRPHSLSLGSPPQLLQPVTQPMTEADFFARQARLQTEARMALAQAKEMAHMQMEIERQRQKKSPITEMVRSSLEKVGIPFPEERRRLSRQILTEMNVAQLQVIVNDLHTQIETLNEQLVKFLMNRDDLHMEQDSMLVDIEDLTRYLGAKEQTVKEQKMNQNNNIPPPSPAPASPLLVINNSVKPRLHRIASLVKK